MTPHHTRVTQNDISFGKTTLCPKCSRPVLKTEIGLTHCTPLEVLNSGIAPEPEKGISVRHRLRKNYHISDIGPKNRN